jgi:hypothetical protein
MVGKNPAIVVFCVKAFLTQITENIAINIGAFIFRIY